MAIELNSMSRDQLLKLRADVDKAISSLEERRKAEALAAAEKAAAELGFSLEQIVASAKKGGSKSPPKYRNPEDPRQTWTGRGRRPAWIESGLEQGKSLEDYAI